MTPYLNCLVVCFPFLDYKCNNGSWVLHTQGLEQCVARSRRYIDIRHIYVLKWHEKISDKKTQRNKNKYKTHRDLPPTQAAVTDVN